MSAIVHVPVDGIGDVPTVVELAHPGIVSEYQTNLAAMLNVFNKEPVDIVDADALVLLAALDNLKDLAENGRQLNAVPTDPNSPIETFRVSLHMAQNIDLIAKSFNAAGLTATDQTATAVRRWKDLSGFGVFEILQSAVSAADTNRSLQALIELEYVRTGNEIIFDSMESLQTALNTTKDALDTLNEIQLIHNQIAAPPVGVLDDVFTTGGTEEDGNPSFDDVEHFLERYNEEADLGRESQLEFFQNLLAEIEARIGTPDELPNDQQLADDLRDLIDFLLTSPEGVDFPGFKDPLDPVVNASATALRDLQNARAQLLQQIATLQAINFIPEFLDPPANTEPNPAFLQSLQGRLQQVVNDINDNVDFSESDPNVALRDWIIDGLDQHGTTAATQTGEIQRHITVAVTAGESLNDAQKADLRRFMLLFEEFYKSASSLLARITQLIEKFAQGIART